VKNVPGKNGVSKDVAHLENASPRKSGGQVHSGRLFRALQLAFSPQTKFL
jgi:hypothetical protein